MIFCFRLTDTALKYEMRLVSKQLSIRNGFYLERCKWCHDLRKSGGRQFHCVSASLVISEEQRDRM